MKITLVVKNGKELMPFYDFLKSAEKISDFRFIYKGLEIDILITGSGWVQTTYSLTRYLQHQTRDLLVHAGMAQSTTEKLSNGQVVQISQDQFGSLSRVLRNEILQLAPTGKEESTIDITDRDGIFVNPYCGDFLPSVKGLTLPNEIIFLSKMDPDQVNLPFEIDLLTEDSAAFFQVALMEKCKFLGIRAISGFAFGIDLIDPKQDKLTQNNLNSVLVEMVLSLVE